MTKHAVIPTDFSIASLQSVHDVMRFYPDQKVKITLLHLIRMPHAIGDLLFRLRRIQHQYPVPESFGQACEVMQHKYNDRLTSIKPLIQYGTSAGYLENLLEGISADAVFLQPEYALGLPFDESIPMTPLLRRCQFKVIETPSNHRPESARVPMMSDLLLAGQ